jgi:hypothetical protein
MDWKEKEYKGELPTIVQKQQPFGGEGPTEGCCYKAQAKT